MLRDVQMQHCIQTQAGAASSREHCIDKQCFWGCFLLVHSSIAKLQECITSSLQSSTVNCPDAASARATIDHFADLMHLSKDKSHLDSYSGRTAPAPGGSAATAGSD